MYEEHVKKIEELKKAERKIKDKIRKELLYHCKSKYPNEVELLEKKICDTIESIEVIQYIYEREYCNVLCVYTKNKVVKFALQWSEDWDGNIPVDKFIYTADDDIIESMDKIYECLPFIETEYL